MAATWNLADKSSLVTLSGGNLTATHDATAAWGSVRATAALGSGGKWFWSHVGIQTTNGGFGIANSAASLSDAIGASSNGTAFYQNGNVVINNTIVATYSTYGVGDVIDIAIDLSNLRIWWRVNGGYWNNSASASPNSNIGGFNFSSVSGPYFPAVSLFQNNSQSANFGASPFIYAAPTGFYVIEIGGGLTKTLAPIIPSTSAGFSGALTSTITPIMLASLGSGERVCSLAAGLGTVLLSGGSFGGQLDCALDPITIAGRSFKWNPVTIIPEIWTPLA